jgi:hypothetical protein
MDRLSVLLSPAGRNYRQPDPPQEVAFSSDLAREFDRYITIQSTNSRIFNHLRMQQFIWYIEHLNQILNSDPNSMSNRSFALRYFEVDDGCLYRKEEYKPDGNGSVFTTPRRYVALERNAFEFITNIHRLLQHFGIQKTYKRVNERYYSITRNDVTWVVNRCTICNLKAAAKDLAPVIPIVASRCLNRFQIDLIDFSTTPDGKYNWIIQGKDPFSRYVLLDALEDKQASSVADIIKQWIGIIGNPRRL